jgi:membrane protease YdiL (CAAX protease family)
LAAGKASLACERRLFPILRTCGRVLSSHVESQSPKLPSSRARLNPAIRVALYLATLMIVGPLLTLASLLIIWGVLGPMLALPLTLGGTADLDIVAARGVLVAATMLVTLLFRRFLDRESLLSLGFQRAPGWLGEGLIGFGLGALLMALILVAELALGGYRVVGLAWHDQSLQAISVLLAVTFLGFVVVAFSEELVARGYILQNLAAAWGTPAAVMISSALFALGHLLNPGASLISTAGLFFAGLLLAASYLASGRLWMPVGLHLSWNFFQGPLFGFPVSGIETGSLLGLERIGNDPLTGGSFGPEASAVGMLAELFGVALLWAWRHKAVISPVREG